MIDISHLVDAAEGRVNAAQVAPGAWCRRVGEPDAGADPYGCADAANILYTIGRFPRDDESRASAVASLQGLQDPATGLWREDTHHTIHTTAHCVAALELFDAGPERPLAELAPLTDPDRMEQFLKSLEWRHNPWRASHQGAGLYAALVLAGEVDRTWRDRYVAWLWHEADADTGFWRQGHMGPVQRGETNTIFPHLAGSFHYLFNLEHERAPLRYPAAMIDSCLALWREREFPIGRAVGFAEIDWVYCLNRARRQTPHRFDEAREALEEFAAEYVEFLSARPSDDRGLGDLHSLFGVVCALAELQTALPGMIRTERPLRLVLDRRPFI